MHPAQYQPGQVLPGTVYRVVRHLATGGMGSVYDVEDVTVEKRYVLKTLHPNLVSREDLALRMRDEAKSLAKLQHPNIVDVVTAGVTSDALKMPFYVMERLIGQNLRVVLDKTGVLHVPHAYRIAIDVADALEHAHENNIVHRDVKPENIFLHRNANGTTTTKLLDFGIVRLLDRKASHTHGKFIGTLRYASPEQITGRKVGPATDIYSLAVVLFEMLAGRGPFDDAGDAYAVGAAHANVPAPPLSRFVRVSPEVEHLVASALAKDPQERPRDCFAFASELRRILRDEEAAPRSATAVNLMSAASPPTQARPADLRSLATMGGPTVQGMIPPSVVLAGPSVVADPATTRAEEVGRVEHVGPAGRHAGHAGGVEHLGGVGGVQDVGHLGGVEHAGYLGHDEARGPVSPIAPTLAAAGLVSHSPNVEIRATPAPAAPFASSPVPPRAVDRNAPTRESAPFGATQRLASNDTQMDPGLLGEDAVRAAMGEAVSLVVPPVAGGAGANPSDDGQGLVFPPMHAASGTGPLAAEAHTRPPERGPFILVGVAAVLAVAMVGGAFVAVRKPWHAGRSDAVSANAASATTASAAAPTANAATSLPVIAAASAPVAVEAPAPMVPAAAPSTASVPAAASVAPSTPSTVGTPSTPKAPGGTPSPGPAPPSTVHSSTKSAGEVKHRPSAPAATKEIPFDP